MDDEDLLQDFFIKVTEKQLKPLSQKPFTDPTPQGLRTGKAKKALIIGLTISGALSVSALPILASANFLTNMLQKTAVTSQASDSTLNSQNVPVLTAAKNIDPNPSIGGGDITLVHGEALMPIDNPEGAIADTVSRPGNAHISVYVVRSDDTLASIAAMFGVSKNTIIGANDIKNDGVYPGQELIILPVTGIQHTVLKDETLTSLARKFKSDTSDIASYNNLENGDPLAVGQSIIIPNGELPAVVVPLVSTHKKIAASKTKSSKAFKPAPLRDAGGPEYENYYVWPVGGGIITQSLHGYNGVDIGAPTGADIYASAGGTVIIAKNNGGWNGGYGNYIVVAHDNGTQTLYSHASKVLVSAGDSVTQGELIGKIGRTGEATGPHLHFEVRGATNPFGAISVGSGQ